LPILTAPDVMTGAGRTGLHFIPRDVRASHRVPLSVELLLFCYCAVPCDVPPFASPGGWLGAEGWGGAGGAFIVWCVAPHTTPYTVLMQHAACRPRTPTPAVSLLRSLLSLVIAHIICDILL
jgi:hypothetical protein